MTLAQILAPVAAATVVNTLLLGLAWRATQIEKRSGSPPWYLGAGIAAYALAGGSFVYAYRGHQISTALEIFGASAVAEIFGAMAVYTLLHGIFRADPITPGQRGFQILVAVGLLTAVFGSLFV